MRPGSKRREQRATHSRPHIQRDSSSRLGELQSPGGSSPHFRAGAINTALLRGDEGVPPSSSGRLGLVLRGEELVRPPGSELGLWICDPPEDWSSEEEGDAFLGALGVDRMEEAPVVEMEGDMEVVDAEFECRD